MDNGIAVLSLCLKNEIFFIDNLSKLRKYLFHKDYYMNIIKAIESCVDNGIKLDKIAIENELKKLKKYDDKTKLILSKIISTNINTDKEVLIEAIEAEYIKRKTLETSSNLSTIANNNPSLSDIINELDSLGSELIDNIESGIGLSKAVEQYLNDLISGNVNLIMSGMESFDIPMGGIDPTGMYLIGGDTGMGKTIFLLQLAHMLAKKKYKVGFYSLELSIVKIVERVLTSFINKSVTEIKLNPDLRKPFIKLVTKIVKSLKESSDYLFLHEDLYTFIDIKTSIKQNQYDVALIENFQLMSYGSNEKFQNRNIELEKISRDSKIFCKINHIPIFYAVQLASKQLKQVPNHIPSIAHIRDNTTCANDSSGVLLLYMPQYYGIETFNDEDTTDKCWFIYDKTRDNPNTIVKTTLNRKKLIFEPIKEEIDGVKKKITNHS